MVPSQALRFTSPQVDVAVAKDKGDQLEQQLVSC